MKVFITGASGFVGHYVLYALKKAGHSVRVLIRPGSENKLPFLEGLELVHGDILDPSPWRSKVKGSDAFIHLIGIIREFPKEGITFQRMHCEATLSALEAAGHGGVSRFLHMSANGAAEDGVSAYQSTKWKAEKLVEASGLEWTIFRPSVIFGDPHGRMEFTTELGKVIARAPIMPVFGGGRYKLEPVAVEDVAACYTRALEKPGAARQVYHIGGGAQIAYRDVIQTIGKALGIKRTKTLNVPFWMVKPAAALLGGFKSFPVTVDQLNMLRLGNVCPEHDYQEVFGIDPVRFAYQNLGYLAELNRKER